MADDSLSRSIETDHLGELAGGKRAVFYDELSQYGARYIYGQQVSLLSVDAESRYHLNNLVLLSMYFDIIFIQTAALFNVNDLFLRRVIQRVIGHPTFRAMLQAGALRICGWGGRSPYEMFTNAWQFARQGVQHPFAPEYRADLEQIFQPPNLTYRVQEHPEDQTEVFRRRLADTELIATPRDVERVERAIHQSERAMGELVSIGFFPALGLQAMQPRSQHAVLASFMTAWNDFLNEAVPGIYTYVSGLDAHGVQHTLTVQGRSVRSFLLSPRIFAAFLQRYFSMVEFNRIINRPYADIHNLRNGDWKRFRDAYHSAVQEISDAMSAMDFSMTEVFNLEDYGGWGQRVWERANHKAGSLDVGAFVQSLASLSGAVFGLGFLGPITHATGLVMGRRLNAFYDRLVRSHGNGTSPYIRKLRMNLALQVTTP